MLAQNQIRVGSPALSTSTRADVSDYPFRLQTLAGVVDKNRAGFQSIGKSVNKIIQGGHVGVAVLVNPLREEFVESV